jgi:hypothetical protein
MLRPAHYMKHPHIDAQVGLDPPTAHCMRHQLCMQHLVIAALYQTVAHYMKHPHIDAQVGFNPPTAHRMQHQVISCPGLMHNHHSALHETPAHRRAGGSRGLNPPSLGTRSPVSTVHETPHLRSTLHETPAHREVAGRYISNTTGGMTALSRHYG